MLSLSDIGSWASIISLGISVLSVLMIGNLRMKIIEMRRKARIRQLIHDIRSIPADAIPLSAASKSKLESLARNLPSGWLFFISKKSKAAWDTQKAIKNSDLLSTKEGIEDWLSHSEDL